MKAFRSGAQQVKGIFSGKKNSKYYRGAFALLFAVVGVAFLLRSLAATGQIYLLPASSSVAINNNVAVAVRINPGTSVEVVENVTVTYDAAKLEFVSIDATGSAFDAELSRDVSTPGKVVFSRAALSNPAVTTDSLIANVNFKALAGSGTTTLTVTGQAAGGGANGSYTNPAGGQTTLTLTGATQTTNSAVYSIESTNPTPATGNQFGLKVYVTSTANVQGGEVKVNLPTGMTYSGTLDTTSTPSAFSPVTTVALDSAGAACTSSQKVCLVFATQNRTLTGKLLVATIPVTASTTGQKSVTLTDGKVVDWNDAAVPTTGTTFNITISSPIAKPTVSLTGGATLGTSINVSNKTQSFTITNLDTAAVYTVTMAGQTLTVATGKFSIPATLRNGDHALSVGVTKSGASETATFTVKLRNPNINRTGCVDLTDLLAVNKAYGSATASVVAEHDLDWQNGVGLIDLLSITANWGTECI